jgi:preprotein translocase subunit SecA
MLESIKRDVISLISRVQIRDPEDVEAVEEQRRQTAEVEYQHESAESMASEESTEETAVTADQPYTRDGEKVGRNDPCPCGSGKKFKQCCGKIS